MRQTAFYALTLWLLATVLVGCTLKASEPPATLVIPDAGATATFQVPVFLGVIEVSPVKAVKDNVQYLREDGEVTLSWTLPPGVPPGVPPDASRVRFFFASTGTGIVPTLIGTDDQLGDGASIRWLVPPGTLGYLSAEALPLQGETVIAASEMGMMIVAEPGS